MCFIARFSRVYKRALALDYPVAARAGGAPILRADRCTCTGPGRSLAFSLSLRYSLCQPTIEIAPPLSQDTWVLWTYQWHPPARGHYTLVARATDGTSQVQTSRWQSTVPNGGTGYPIIPVDLI